MSEAQPIYTNVVFVVCTMLIVRSSCIECTGRHDSSIICCPGRNPTKIKRKSNENRRKSTKTATNNTKTRTTTNACILFMFLAQFPIWCVFSHVSCYGSSHTMRPEALADWRRSQDARRKVICPWDVWLRWTHLRCAEVKKVNEKYGRWRWEVLASSTWWLVDERCFVEKYHSDK